MGKLNWWRVACAVGAFCSAGVIPSAAQTFKTVVNFSGVNGATPEASPVHAFDGNLYGTTSAVLGGTGNCGTFFRLTPAGALTTLQSFDCTDGSWPFAPLVLGADGNFYGTTIYGGANGDGTIFRMSPTGTLTTLHDFDSTDGSDVLSGLVLGADGNFYGTTAGGGANGYGTVFRMTPAGSFTTLHNFAGGSGDGAYPYSGLVQGSNGSLYGTTDAGGSSSLCSNGCGTIFKITSRGVLSTLHEFKLWDGASPDGTLVEGTDGNFYGTAFSGGVGGYGTVFRLTPSGILGTLHTFSLTDGANPYAGLVLGTDGNFYGTTNAGGTHGDGVLFRITTKGTLSILHDFDSTDGDAPAAALVQDTSGVFYGTTVYGGASTYGTLFSLSVGLRPFVETNPASGKVGAAVKILGTNLTAANGVIFNGTAATFKVISRSLISTTVPAGATSGKVEVTTPYGSFTSNVLFRVRQ